jgi:DNA-binding winged helix-turn-helix (wHTH) protein
MVEDLIEQIKKLPEKERLEAAFQVLRDYLGTEDQLLPQVMLSLGFTRTEAKLFVCLYRRKNNLVQKTFLFDFVFDHLPSESSKIVDVIIFKMRKKLSGSESYRIDTVWGQGYQLSVIGEDIIADKAPINFQKFPERTVREALSIESGSPKVGAPWTKEDKIELLKMSLRKAPLSEMAKRFGRTERAINCKLSNLRQMVLQKDR